MDRKMIDKIVWWIPFRKVRDNVRVILLKFFFADFDKEYWNRILMEHEHNMKSINEISVNNKCISVNNCKFNLKTELYSLWEVFFRRDYEFGGLKDVVFIDVGAYVGDSTIYAAYNENVCMVYAYEPFIDNFNMLTNNTKLNSDRKIKIFQYGWGEKDEKLKIPLYHRNISMTHSNNKLFCDSQVSFVEDNIIGYENIEIKEASSIFKYILSENTNNPIVLKLDIEGSELEVIKNLDKNNLIERIDIILMEWHCYDYHIVTDILEKYGFIWFNEYLTENAGLIRGYNKDQIRSDQIRSDQIRSDQIRIIYEYSYKDAA